MADKSISKTKEIITFIATIIVGFFLFALPNLFFGITKIDGGLKGVNLLIIALFQFVSVSALIYVSLRSVKKDFRYIGLSSKNWVKDGALGLLVGLTWAAIQFGVIIPHTGGPERSDIAQELQMFDGSPLGLISIIALGVIGGGITEEIYNRGYFINVLKGFFKNEKAGLWVASVLAILFFAAGHLPSSPVLWIDKLVPSTAYTLLFVSTRRLTASMMAHSTWNLTAILVMNFAY